MGIQTTLTDEQLIAQYYAGQDRAFEELYLRYWQRLFAYFQQLGFNPQKVEDLVQETFLKVISTKGRQNAQFQANQGSFKAWMYKIAYRCALDEWDRAKKRKRMEIEADAEPSLADAAWVPPSFAEDPEAEEFYRAFAECLSWLRPAERAAAFLVYLEGVSSAEAAEALDTTATAVNVNLSRARKTLPDCMKKKGHTLRPAVSQGALEQARIRLAVELENGTQVIREEADHD